MLSLTSASFSKKWGRLFLFGTIVLLMPASVLNVLAQPPAAPKFKSKPIDPKYSDEKYVSNERNKKTQSLAGSYDAKAVSDFYYFYLIPRLTQVDHLEFANEVRADIQNDMFKVNKSAKAQFNTMLKGMLDEIASGSGKVAGQPEPILFHPSAVINAILLMGEINSDEKTGNVAPKPLKEATFSLYKFSVDKDASDYVRAAALVGLERHIRLDKHTYTPEMRTNLADRLIASLDEPKPLMRSDEAHAYLRRKFLEILVQFDSDKHSAVRDFVLAAIANRSENPNLREYCLSIVPRINKDASPEQLMKAATGLTHFVMHRAEDWKKKVSDVVNPAASSSYGGGGQGQPMQPAAGAAENDTVQNSGGGQGGVTAPTRPAAPPSLKETQPPEVRVARRQLNQLLDAVHLALNAKMFEKDTSKGVGFKETITEPQLVAAIDGLIVAVEALQKEVNAATIKDKKSLATSTESKIEELLRLAKEFPGVAELDAKKDAEVTLRKKAVPLVVPVAAPRRR